MYETEISVVKKIYDIDKKRLRADIAKDVMIKLNCSLGHALNVLRFAESSTSMKIKDK